MRFDLPRTNKVLADVHGKPLLHHILDHYVSEGVFKQIILCLGNDAEMIENSVVESENFSSDSWKGLGLKLLDTGEHSTSTFRITEALKYISETDFFVGYADVLSNIDIRKMISEHFEESRDITMALVKARMPYGRVMLNEEDRVYDFVEKPILEDWINAGSFILRSSIFQDVDVNLEFERELLPRMLREGKRFFGYKHNGFWKGVDTYKNLVALREEWNEIKASNHF
jgi:glucose-1-phosphate cytidylyltransferase